jgi:hypothetical protein
VWALRVLTQKPARFVDRARALPASIKELDEQRFTRSRRIILE